MPLGALAGGVLARGSLRTPFVVAAALQLLVVTAAGPALLRRIREAEAGALDDGVVIDLREVVGESCRSGGWPPAGLAGRLTPGYTGPMDLDAGYRLAIPGRRVREVANLTGYPAWLGVVLAVVPAETVEGDAGPAWTVDIGARVGPFKRSKRCAWVRTVEETGAVVRFYRAEVDGGSIPRGCCALQSSPAPSRHLGGDRRPALRRRRPATLVDRILAEELRRAGGRLDRVLREA